MKRLSTVDLLFTLFLAPALCLAGGPVQISTLEDGSTIGVDPSGIVMWHNFGRSSVAATPNAIQVHSGPLSVTMPTWDQPITLDSTPLSVITGPVFDVLGNAWVVINDSVNLVAFQSNGTSGTWQPPHIIAPVLPAIGAVALAADNAGGIYVTYGTSASPSATSNPLMLAKYTPVTGWQTPTQIYNSPKSFSETSCAVDSTGRLVVVFNPNGISSIASNAGQTSWGAVQIIASSEDAGLLPSLAGNKSGNRLALIYLADTIGRKGMRYTFFNSSTGKWGAPVAVPNSGAATFLAYTAVSSFPLAVDEAGNVTFTATMSSTTRAADSQEARPAPAYVIDGFRYEGGAWSQQQLTSPSGSLPDLETSSGTALSSSGVVLIATPLSDGLHGVNITAFRYTPGIGWDTEIAAHYDTSTEIRCSAAWFEGTEAVVVYSDYSMPGIPLVAALYSNGAWGNGPAPPGNPSGVAYPALATAPSGEAFLAMPDNPAVNVTFLRP